MLDRALIGRTSGASAITVERLHLKMFARAIGETRPIYFDADAARAAGYPDIVAPPTFLMALEAFAPPLGGLNDVPLPPEILLHGEQAFAYERLIFAGDVIELKTRIVDIYEKKGGALEFIESETTGIKQDDGAVAVRMTTILVLRHAV